VNAFPTLVLLSNTMLLFTTILQMKITIIPLTLSYVIP
jgi:hypothetical protein